MKKGLAVCAVCAAALLFGGCNGETKEEDDKIRVGVTCYDKSDTFVSELMTCFEEELKKEDNISWTIRDAAGSQRTQDDQVKELIDAGCDVICVNLVDRADPSQIIDFARENDVPLVFFNREPVAEDMMQWERLYYVGAEAKQSGVMQGELAADAIKGNGLIDRNKDGKIQYVVLEGEPGHQDSIIRTENAVETLKRQGIVLEKLSYGIANWNRAQAQNRMLQMISQHQTQIELVLANNDDMALGAIDAYEKLNYTESVYPVFFGIDGTKAGLNAVKEGRIAGTVYNDKEGQAKAMAKLTVAAVQEAKEEKYTYLPYFKVTKGNVEDFE